MSRVLIGPEAEQSVVRLIRHQGVIMTASLFITAPGTRYLAFPTQYTTEWGTNHAVMRTYGVIWCVGVQLLSYVYLMPGGATRVETGASWGPNPPTAGGVGANCETVGMSDYEYANSVSQGWPGSPVSVASYDPQTNMHIVAQLDITGVLTPPGVVNVRFACLDARVIDSGDL